MQTVPKCCRKQYEIKIFVVRDEKILERSWKWKSGMSKKHGKTQGKLMLLNDRSREKVKKLIKQTSFSRGAHGLKMLYKTIWNQDFQCAWPTNDLWDHENEDHVWWQNIGAPKENQFCLKIAHERKWKSLQKTDFPEVPWLKNAVNKCMKSIFSSCVTKKWLERSWKWTSCMSQRHRKTCRKQMTLLKSFTSESEKVYKRQRNLKET